MSVSWYPQHWELDVDNPRYGELVLRAVHEDQNEWEATFPGPQIGALLEAVTELALGLEPAPGRVGAESLPPMLTAAAARTLLPALQRAVVLAAAGTDIFQRTFPDPDEPPAKPFCHRCGTGSAIGGVATISPACDDAGHHAYGTRPEASWEHVHELHTQQRQRWDRERETARFDAELRALLDNAGETDR
ncbi:hypothetical protein [Dactylosporangium sp. CA-233914]|uniref:hypothetical protein n=1 Tax=Dactylosporangium sp. CA-233914 TaxID=3239934 RepID=UPI003D90A552